MTNEQQRELENNAKQIHERNEIKSMWSPLPFDLKRPVVIAHRGLPEIALENTNRSFELAIETGTDTVETDVHVTADGHVVCTHDDNLLRVAGRNERICDLKLSEALALFPALLEYRNFLSMTGSMPVMVDTKGATPEAFQVIGDATERAGFMDRIIFTAYNYELARAIRKRFPDVAISIHVPEGLDPLDIADEVKASCIRLLPTEYLPELIARIHERGYATIAVAAPTASTRTSTNPDALRAIADLGISAVITDRCDWAVKIFKELDNA
ncbi:glycerophosphodiester phosphodiesterase [Paenibacillus periandrae]|uniref:glycerophosphodiester phosphodiesterase n=1 Tax=Paenibacillus periandrae TaxID=1761741 RepID=UPI001F095F96|nr:glycerophosphodiester phosphodiesterase [Paenibacillus periandrae]